MSIILKNILLVSYTLNGNTFINQYKVHQDDLAIEDQREFLSKYYSIIEGIKKGRLVTAEYFDDELFVWDFEKNIIK